MVSVILLLPACKGESPNSIEHPVKLQFQSQVEQSCKAGKVYVKQVEDLSDAQAEPEEKEYLLSQKDERDEGYCLLQGEVQLALDLLYDEPEVKDYFEIARTEDTLFARVIEGMEKLVSLQKQRILYDSRGEMIRYISSTYMEEYWLYATRKEVEVVFDSLGNYASHKLEVYTKIFSITTPFHAKIEGKLAYQ